MLIFCDIFVGCRSDWFVWITLYFFDVKIKYICNSFLFTLASIRQEVVLHLFSTGSKCFTPFYCARASRFVDTLKQRFELIRWKNIRADAFAVFSYFPIRWIEKRSSCDGDVKVYSCLEMTIVEVKRALAVSGSPGLQYLTLWETSALEANLVS